MLKELYIKNIAVIDEQCLVFEKGFQVFTGETGAGKSILLAAVGLILGQKATTDLVRDGKKEAIVEATFDTKGALALNQLLETEGISPGDVPDELIIRRQLLTDGNNKIYINQQRANLQMLQRLSQHLIDFTGQLAQLQIKDPANDICILDAFLANKSLLDSYAKAYAETRETFQRVEELKRAAAQKEDRLEWLAFRLKEFEKLTLRSDEQEKSLRDLREKRKHSAAVIQFGVEAAQCLTDGEHNITRQLQLLKDQILKNKAINNLFPQFIEPIEAARIMLEDLAYEIGRATAKTDSGSGLSTDDIEEKLFVLEQLKRKYGPLLDDVVQHEKKLLQEKQLLENADDQLVELEQKQKGQITDLKALADGLSQGRQKAAMALETAIKKELKSLNMPGVAFGVDMKKIADTGEFTAFTPRGLDQVQFLLSTNPGLSLRPLAKIASGGETSRIFLAIKRVMAKDRSFGSFIFDEIDTGISGSAVELVGKKLKELSREFQVFCVTHHAQIAAQADGHYLVGKDLQKNQTVTRIERLGQKERVQEVARLMGGVTITDKNLAFAHEMLSLSK